jgi:hypothetical protein
MASSYFSQKQYARAISEYSQVDGNPLCRFLANYYSASSNYSRLLELQNHEVSRPGAPNGHKSEAEKEIQSAVINQLRNALSIAAKPEINKCLSDQERIRVHRTKGQATYTLALLLQSAQQPNPHEILHLLEDYEASYPEVASPYADVFTDVAEWRLRALESLGDDAQAETEVRQLIENHAKNDPDREFIRNLGSRFWASANYKLANFDQTAGMQDVKITILLYQPFEDELKANADLAKGNSKAVCILLTAYFFTKDWVRADDLFDLIKRKDPKAYCAKFQRAPIKE